MRRREIPLLIAVFLDLVGFGLAFTDIQFRLKSFGSPGWLVGLALSSYYLAQIVVSPHWGRLSDRVGRKAVLLACTGLSGLSMCVYAFADSVAWIVVSRVVAGFAAANVVVAQAYLADVTQGEARAAALGRLNGALMAGLFAGFTLGGWVAEGLGTTTVALAAGGASFAAVAAIALGLPHVPPKEKAEETPRGEWALLREVPGLARMLFLTACGWFVIACLEGTFGLLLREKLGLAQGWFGTLAGYETLVGAGIGFAYGWFSMRWRPHALLRAGFVIQGLGVALFPFAPSIAVLFLLSTLFAVGGGLISPTVGRVCSDLTPEERQGEMFGLLQAARSFGFLLGPAIGGTLFDLYPEAPYLMAGAVAMVVALFVPKSRASTTT